MFKNMILYTRLKFISRILTITIFITLAVFIKAGNTQDLILQDMTISTTETYEASNSITAGSGFTIASTGVVTFKSGDFITLKPGFVVVGGGEFYGLTGVSTDLVTNPILEIPSQFELQQNYPNPFNPTTKIEFSLPEASDVTLKIYNNLGEEIATLVSNRLNAGKYTCTWDASRPAGMASGVYLYRLEVKGSGQGTPNRQIQKGQARQSFVETRKMILMR